jgi:hypothetical protein
MRGTMTKRTAPIAAFLNIAFTLYLSRTMLGSMTGKVHLMLGALSRGHHLLDAQASQHVLVTSGKVGRLEEDDNAYGQHDQQFPYGDAHPSSGGGGDE